MKKRVLKQLSGTSLKKDESGTGCTRLTLLAKTFQRNPAPCAESCSSPGSAKLACAAPSVSEQDVTTYSAKLGERGRVPVYDLMVDIDHEFFAYGVLVHNCIDSLSLVANLVSTIYAKADESEEWEPIDVVSGI